MLENILLGLSVCVQPINIAMIVGGLFGGMIFGALPGLSATMAVAVLVPLTYWVPPESGLIMLGGIFCGAIYGGSIPAILLRIPGTPASVPTSFDGNAFTQKGEGARALGLSTFSSAVGGTLSGFALLLFGPLLAIASLYFGPPEMMALAIFGLSVVSSLSPGAVLKGLIACLLGLVAATVGMDPVQGYPRMTFGMFELLGGVPLIPVLVGLFSVPPLIDMIDEGVKKYAVPDIKGSTFVRLGDVKKTIVTTLRSAAIGIVIGIIPAAGPEIAAFIAYNEARRTTKDPDSFGKGNLDALAAPESAHSACTGGSLIPLFTLGIPGSAPAAIFLGAMMIHGLRPGPMMFEEKPEIGYAVIVGFILTNLLLYFMGGTVCRAMAQAVRTPQNVLAPIVLILTMVGAYAVGGTIVDVWVMWGAGLVAYLLQRAGFPLSPICLALILGPVLEAEAARTLVMFNGDMLQIVTRPIAMGLLLVGVLMFCGPFLAQYLRQRREQKAA